jgi:hypothetical protein
MRKYLEISSLSPSSRCARACPIHGLIGPTIPCIRIPIYVLSRRNVCARKHTRARAHTHTHTHTHTHDDRHMHTCTHTDTHTDTHTHTHRALVPVCRARSGAGGRRNASINSEKSVRTYPIYGLIGASARSGAGGRHNASIILKSQCVYILIRPTNN